MVSICKLRGKTWGPTSTFCQRKRDNAEHRAAEHPGFTGNGRNAKKGGWHVEDPGTRKRYPEECRKRRPQTMKRNYPQ
eukprot:2743492-Pyramimonas_sp.AAC.1